MRLSAVLDILKQIAPEHLAESWDKVGLHVGDTAQRVRRAMLCIDLTEAVMREVIAKRCDLVVAYHPPIFDPLKTLTSLDSKQRMLRAAVRANVAIYSPHTALDAASGGVNDWLASSFGAGDVRPIRVAKPERASRYILTVFVPVDRAEALRDELAKAGAGKIGDYSYCSFATPGEGTFLGGPTTNPTVGKRGRLERVRELRMEMTCPSDRVTEVVAALRRAHPYEVPSFDLYQLHAAPEGGGTGQGRVVDLARPVTVNELVTRVKKRLRVKNVEVGGALPGALSRKRLKKLGVCAGAGGGLLNEVRGIDAFVTGEMRHHDILAAAERGVVVILAGHTQTERPYLAVYREQIRKAGAADVEWFVSRSDRPPGEIR